MKHWLVLIATRLLWGSRWTPVPALLAVGLSAGCQPPEAKVIDRLPMPAQVQGSRYSPRPRFTPVRQTPSAPQSAQGWLPPGGLSRDWTCMVIHHSASAYGSLRDIDRWHRDKGWDGCGYDFVIGDGSRTPDGAIEVSPRWRRQAVGAHTKLSPTTAAARGLDPNHYNEHGIGICLVGRFDTNRPSERQKASLARLVRFLMDTCDIPESRIYPHGDLKSTHCPGKNFSLGDLKRRVRALR